MALLIEPCMQKLLNNISLSLTLNSSEAASDYINARRLAVGISTAELSRRIGSNPKRLWYVLNGQREMRVDEFLKLCVALRIDPRSFVTREMVEQIAEASKPKK